MASSSTVDEAALEERLGRLCLMDDVFMTAFFDGDLACVEHVLRIIMGRPGLIVKSVRVQRELKNLHGRSLRLDILAEDEDGTEIDIEVQREDRGASAGGEDGTSCAAAGTSASCASPRRARYHGSLIDANVRHPIGKYCEGLRDNCVIFITENDVLGGGQPIYVIRRHIELPAGPCRPFGDGSTVIYVNGSMRDERTELGRLMHDFFCARASDMHSPVLAERMKQLKESERGGMGMSSVVDEIKELFRDELTREVVDKVTREVRDEVTREVTDKVTREVRDEVTQEVVSEERRRSAVRMLTLGKIPKDDIAQYCELDLETVERLASELAAS